MTTTYWDTARPTYIENWPAALQSLSMASIDVPLTVDDARRLGTNIVELGEAFCETDEDRKHNAAAADSQMAKIAAKMQGLPGPATEIRFVRPKWVVENIEDIRTRVAEAVAMMPSGAFVRLGSRSPKDSWEGHKNGFKVLPGEDPLRFMLDASERTSDDLLLAIDENYPPHIFVRQWMRIPQWAEFRCFMKDRKLVGISQYNYLDSEVFPEIGRDADTIRWAIDQFFSMFRSASHLDDVVFDVWVEPHTMRDNTRVWEVKLVEINPSFELTDPCLFKWGEDFGGEFRYNNGLDGLAVVPE